MISSLNLRGSQKLLVDWVYRTRCWKRGGAAEAHCEKKRGAHCRLWKETRGCPMPDTASSRCLCNRPNTGHSWAHQPSWWYLLWKHIKERAKMPKCAGEEGWGECEKTAMWTPMSEEEGGGGAPGAPADIPLQPREETPLEQTPTLQPMEDPMPKQADISL